MLTISLLLIVNLFACKSKQNDMVNKYSEMQEQLDSLMGCYFNDSIPGAVMIVMKDDSVIYHRDFGVADMTTGDKVSLSSMFNICSISKQFSAVALMKLAEEGKLSLDDTVDKYFPNLKQPFFKKITLRHLLSHTSGIPDSRPRTPDEWAAYRAKHDSQFSSVDDFKLFCEEDESLRYLESLDSLNFEPGTAYEYMNPTFQMVLSIVEQATGVPFEQWMHDNIILPSGMTETVYFDKDREIPRMVHAYEKDAAGNWEESDYGEANFFGTKADGGIYTTPLDFLKWNKAVFGDKIISKESREMAHTDKIATDIPYTSYGYGWFIEERPGKPRKIFHTGDNGGFRTVEAYFPEQNLFYLIFAAHPYWERDVTAEKVDDILIKAVHQ